MPWEYNQDQRQKGVESIKDIIVLNAQARSPDRPSLRYSSGGSGPLIKKNEAFCLATSNGGGGQYIQRNKSDYRGNVQMKPKTKNHKSRDSYAVKACIGRKCAKRDIRCHECVMIQGKPSEYEEMKA